MFVEQPIASSKNPPPTPNQFGVNTARNSRGNFYTQPGGPGNVKHNPFMAGGKHRSQATHGGGHGDGGMTPIGQLSRAPSQLIPQASGSTGDNSKSLLLLHHAPIANAIHSNNLLFLAQG
jgi:hypothetical protein